MSNNNHSESDHMKVEPQPLVFSFFNINKLSKGSLQRYQTFYKQDSNDVIFNKDTPLEQKVQEHFNGLKLDDKQVLEKFLRLKKDESSAALAKRSHRVIKTNAKN